MQRVEDVCIENRAVEESQVVANSTLEQRYVLRDQPDASAQLGLARRSQINAAQPEGAVGRVVEPEQQSGDGRLAAAHVSQYAEDPTRSHGKRDIVEDRDISCATSPSIRSIISPGTWTLWNVMSSWRQWAARSPRSWLVAVQLTSVARTSRARRPPE
jgi:hypothetical protein